MRTAKSFVLRLAAAISVSANSRWILTLVVVATCGCSTPPWRDFASGPAPVKADAAISLIDPSASAPADLAPLLAQIRERAGIPGVAAAVLRGKTIIAEGVAGVRRRGSDVAVTIDDAFEIASCAKAISATVVAKLVEERKMDWDWPLSRYFPDEILDPAWSHVTLRHLLSHTAGVRDPWVTFLTSTYFDRGTLRERRAAFVRRVLKRAPAAPPGAEMVYCNTDFILVAAAAEKVTGTEWEQLMGELVFRPLGLTTAGFGPPGLPGRALQPWGHGKYRFMQLGLFGNAAFDPGAATADYPAIASPAGFVHLSIKDWARFVSLHLRADPANPHVQAALLSPRTFAALHGITSKATYSGGWYVGSRSWAKGDRVGDTGRVLYHVGDNGRWTSVVWLAPEIDFAVLVTCNRGDRSAAVDEVASRLVATYARVKVE